MFSHLSHLTFTHRLARRPGGRRGLRGAGAPHRAGGVHHHRQVVRREAREAAAAAAVRPPARLRRVREREVRRVDRQRRGRGAAAVEGGGREAGARSGAPCASEQHSNGTGATIMSMAAMRRARVGAVAPQPTHHQFGGGSRVRTARHLGYDRSAPVGAPQPG